MLKELKDIPADQLVEDRINKFSNMGVYVEDGLQTN
jgi:acetyl-CoA carboxylase alpha subunit